MHYYHLQLAKNGTLPKPPHSLILKPQVPNNLFVDYNDDVIEDWFTPRVCLAATIEDAIAGLTVPSTYYDVYRTVQDLQLEQPHTSGPSTPEMSYGESFVMNDWLDYESEQDEDFEVTESWLQEQFAWCVPDADETNEYWSLVPVRVEYQGVYNTKTKRIAEPEETSTRKVARQLRAMLARYR